MKFPILHMVLQRHRYAEEPRAILVAKNKTLTVQALPDDPLLLRGGDVSVLYCWRRRDPGHYRLTGMNLSRASLEGKRSRAGRLGPVRLPRQALGIPVSEVEGSHDTEPGTICSRVLKRQST